MKKNILVTGGAGYIGSHTVIELINAGYQPVIVDNLVNSSKESIKRIEQITEESIPFFEENVEDERALEDLFRKYNFESVIHFAGLKAVGESVKKPLEYYYTNLNSTINLINVMIKNNVKKLVFSSSATVYGDPESLPLTEESRTGVGITNPYGHTKYFIEQIIRDVVVAKPDFEAVILRYFNPIGAHKSGLIGEDPNGIPNNLFPYIAQVAVGKLKFVNVFGDDYDTVDGTGVRDYIHVVDLARGHVYALKNIKPGVSCYNLGTGKGTSVLQLIKAFEAATKKDVPYRIGARREGDVASCYADCRKAEKELGWKAELSIEQACQDSWRWQSNNPNGYK